MGPTTLFDKSFLQSLNVDESVWFDNFFRTNICPLFYVETMADLEKEVRAGKTPEQVVGEIANKTPEMGSVPNIYHMELFMANLMGRKVAGDGRPVVAGGRSVESEGKKGVVIDEPPEAKAFTRWQRGEYLQIEREFAKAWRVQVKSLTFEKSAEYAAKLGIDITKCKNIDDSFQAASNVISNSSKPYDLLEFILTSFGIPREYHETIVARYQRSSFPPLNQYAPYAAHVVLVEVFFHICVSRGFISGDRPSNKVDVSYLHYLPFCQVFVSGDRLHRQTAPLFLRKNQTFVWGPDLKADLGALNEHYLTLPDAEKEKGLMSFATYPPKEGNYLTCQLWDFVNPNWRKSRPVELPLRQDLNEKLVKQIQGFATAETLPPEKVDFEPHEAESLTLQRSLRKRKGTWYQLPKDLEHD